MSAAMDADEGDHPRIDFLQGFAVPEGDKPVARTMNDISMAFYPGDPFVGTQMKPQYHPYR